MQRQGAFSQVFTDYLFYQLESWYKVHKFIRVHDIRVCLRHSAYYYTLAYEHIRFYAHTLNRATYNHAHICGQSYKRPMAYLVYSRRGQFRLEPGPHGAYGLCVYLNARTPAG